MKADVSERGPLLRRRSSRRSSRRSTQRPRRRDCLEEEGSHVQVEQTLDPCSLLGSGATSAMDPNLQQQREGSVSSCHSSTSEQLHQQSRLTQTPWQSTDDQLEHGSPRGSTDGLSPEGGHVPVESPTPDHDNYSKWGPGATRTRPKQPPHQQPRLTNIPCQSPTGNKVRRSELQSWRSTDSVLDGGSNTLVTQSQDHYLDNWQLLQQYIQPSNGRTVQNHGAPQLRLWRSTDCVLDGGSNTLVPQSQDQYMDNWQQLHQYLQPSNERTVQNHGAPQLRSWRSTDCVLDGGSNTLVTQSQDHYLDTTIPGQQFHLPRQEIIQSTQSLLEEVSNALVASTQGPNNLIQTIRPEQQRYQQSRHEITLHQSATSREPQTSRNTGCLDGRGINSPVTSPHYPHENTNHGSTMSSLPPTEQQVQPPTIHRSPIHSPRYNKTPAWKSFDCLLEERDKQDTYNVSQDTGSGCSTSVYPQPRDEGTRHHQHNHCKYPVTHKFSLLLLSQ